MRTTRMIAIALASILAVSSLTSCSLVKKAKNIKDDLFGSDTKVAVDDKAEAPEESSDASAATDDTANVPTEAPEQAAEGEASAESETTEAEPLPVGIDAYNWKYSDDTVLYTIAGEPVTFDFYRHYAMYNKAAFDQNDNSYWTEETESYYKGLLKEQFQILAANKILAERYDCNVTEEQYAEFNAQIKEMIDTLGEDEYRNQLNSVYLTEEIMAKLSEGEYCSANVLNHFIDEEGVDTYIKDNYVTVQHVLISTLDENGDEYTGEKLEEKVKLANDIYERAKKGEDFRSLIDAYGQDPGMEAQDYYTFTYNTMVKEFEDASYSLEVGEISEPVKTSYGYHIIKKLPLEPSTVKDPNSQEYWMIISELGYYDEYNAAFEECLASLEIIESPELGELTMINIGTPKE